ncbi:hypothetical protein GCM10018781_22850 [Kitasatospora indigofera]|uniref:N-acetyltransferase domain-containing protein n=1 Tax=Kitasatospora indigofera TaxID=67307 RepID=A0A919FKL3_9ACTN|nr:GNAT family N-acetyltransferase [Kitasatospora indigofera]GHH67501.1 hypothetical protein GCM10018781_22850 [Kitasatospora indigofera]
MNETDPPAAGAALVGRAGAVRRATAADAPALVRLRGLMLEAMDVPTGPEQAPWRADALAWFTERLGRPEEFAAFLVEDRELGVVSCAVGSCERHAPGPANRSGLQGHVFNVSTDPRRQGRGHARACLDALLAWFAADTGARVVNLNATADGAGLYRSLGFAAPRFPALQLRIGTGA